MSDVIGEEEIRQVQYLSEHNAGRSCAVCGEDADLYLVTSSVSTLFLCEADYEATKAANNGEVSDK